MGNPNQARAGYGASTRLRYRERTALFRRDPFIRLQHLTAVPIEIGSDRLPGDRPGCRHIGITNRSRNSSVSPNRFIFFPESDFTGGWIGKFGLRPKFRLQTNIEKLH